MKRQRHTHTHTYTQSKVCFTLLIRDSGDSDLEREADLQTDRQGRQASGQTEGRDRGS